MSQSSVQSIGGKYPITALDIYVDSENVQHLLWGAGSELCIRNFEGEAISRFPISSNDSVHGIRSYGKLGLVAAYGGKSLLLVTKNCVSFKPVASCQQLDDMILDFLLPITTTKSNQHIEFGKDHCYLECFIGYSHNFIDVAEIKAGTNQYACKRRIQCPEVSVLFNMTIYPNSTRELVSIASGTVFGKIILWSATPDASAGTVHSIASDHEGVIFRIKWSAGGNRIVSVSDDRTVRVWQVTQSLIGTHNVATGLYLLFTGWGHISRVWDAVFLRDRSSNGDDTHTTTAEVPNDEDCEIATCSEDGTVKLWSNLGQCTATLCGHSNDVWRMTTAHAGQMIISGGNDSSIKAWDVAYQRKVAPEDSSSALFSVPIPPWAVNAADGSSADASTSVDDVSVIVGASKSPVAATSESDNTAESIVDTATEGSNNVLGGMDLAELAKPKKKKASTASRRANGVCSVRISPCLRWLVVVLVEGGIWLVRLSSNQDPLSLDDSNWIPVTHLKTVVSTMDAHFVYRRSDDLSRDLVAMKLLISHLNGENLSIVIRINHSAGNSTESEAGIVSKAAWKAHEFRTVNIWFAAEDAVVAITATIKGACSLWKLGCSADGRGDGEAPQLWHTCTTPGKEIVTACALISRRFSTYLVLGDARGSVSVYVLPAGDNGASTRFVSLSPTACFMKLHGTDPVSCIEPHPLGFVTAGHDGMVHIYHEAEGRFLDIPGKAQRWLHTSKLNCLPISTPDQIIISTGSSGGGSGDDVSGFGLYVCGYHGSAFMIWDLRRGYQVMRVEGGGWKRPHRCMLSTLLSDEVPFVKDLPGVLFVCPAPLLKDNTVLQLFGATPKLYPPADYAVMSGASAAIASVPLHIGSAGHGRVTYCATFITSALGGSAETPLQSSHIVVGGEDSCVKVYSVPDLVLRQEVSLSLNSSMKALSSARSSASADRGIVVGGGGKLLYNIWLFDGCGSASASSSLGRVLYTGVEGSIWAKATQDHRILSVQCAYLDHRVKPSVSTKDHHPTGIFVERYLILLCDSRGSATLALFDHAPLSAPGVGLSVSGAAAALPYTQFTVLQQLQPSQCPLLSSALLITPSSPLHSAPMVLAVFGDTAGIVSVWAVRRNDDREENPTSTPRYIIFAFLFFAIYLSIDCFC